MKKFLFPVLFLLILHPGIFPSPLYSPTWGYSLDLPEGYEYAGGDSKDRFSFQNPAGAQFDLVVYYASPGKAAPYASIKDMAQDVQKRLNNKGDIDYFEYRQKNAALMELAFSSPASGGRSSQMSGWAICTELGKDAGGLKGQRALLLAMAYGPAEKQDLMVLHFSALDSLAPEESDRLAPGYVTEYAYPRENPVEVPVFGLGVNAHIYKEDAEAAKALVDREFQVLRRYTNSPDWQEAWSRFYRAIYRDSFDRLADVAFQIERKLNLPAGGEMPAGGQTSAGKQTASRENRDFADQALQWVQSFTYERDLIGSDFVNLVTAATEGRGDCDSRAMLWAIILKQANIPSAIMVSRTFSHAMGLADLPGDGAHFEIDGKKYLVAETTAKVSIGMIAEDVSEVSQWLGIRFE